MKDFNTFLLMFIAAGEIVIIYLLSTRVKKHKPHNGDTGNDSEAAVYFSKLSFYEGNFLINSITGKFTIMALSLTDTQQASGVLTFKDKKLAVTDVPDGSVTLSVADENVATASYEDSTNTVTVKANQPGVTALKITAKNKAGNDIPFEDIAIEVTSGDAATGGVDFGEPTEQPE